MHRDISSSATQSELRNQSSAPVYKPLDAESSYWGVRGVSIKIVLHNFTTNCFISRW